MELLVLGALVLLLLIYLAGKKGKAEAKNEYNEEILDDIRQAKEIRDSLSNKSVRSKLRDILNKRS